MLNALVKYNWKQKTYKCLGRGKGSGKGKTCGRGTKGQKARSGRLSNVKIFQGGQTPFFRSIPKRGMRCSRRFISKKSFKLFQLMQSQLFHKNSTNSLKLTSLSKSINKEIKLFDKCFYKVQVNFETNIITKNNISSICNRGSIVTIV